MSNGDFSGILGAAGDLERELQNYLRGDESVSGTGLGYSPGSDDDVAVGAITALGYDTETAIGAVKAAKAAAVKRGLPPSAGVSAAVKAFVENTVTNKIKAFGNNINSNTLAKDLSVGSAFQFEGSICVASFSKAIGFGTSETIEATLDRPAVIREIRFSTNDAGLTLTDFRFGGNFPWFALQFPVSLAHFAPGTYSYKVRAQAFPNKTTFKATIKNGNASGTLTPILELWGTASD